MLAGVCSSFPSNGGLIWGVLHFAVEFCSDISEECASSVFRMTGECWSA